MENKMANRTLQNFIDGKWVDAEGGANFDVLNPLDDSLYAQAANSTASDMHNAVAAAKSAFTAYRATSPTERERWLLRVAEVMEERQQDLVNCLVDEIGSPIQKAMFEFTKGLTMVRAAAGLCRNVRGETIPSDAPGKFSMSIREPLGVVGVITPFNVPLIKTTRLVANSLAVGNTVVHLPSEMAPHLTVLFAEIVAEAGFPEGSYNVVTGFGHEIGDSLTSHTDVDFVTFTGSSVVGQHINEICARNKTPCTLELGGKSPTVILADADLDTVMPLAARSIFMFAGQACIGSSRFYVERPLYEEFVKRFTQISAKVGMGDLRDPNTVIAPIISNRQRERIKDHIADAIAKGATIAAGGEWEGNRCQPTLLTGVSEEMTVCKSETFGPVTSIYPIDSYEEGLEKANGPTIHDEAHIPFGGNGESGVGREGTDADMEAMTELKWVTVQL